jgi:hypothetical protein
MVNSCTEYFEKNILEKMTKIEKSGEYITNVLIKIPYKCSKTSQRDRTREKLFPNNNDYQQIISDINTDNNYPYKLEGTDECSGRNPYHGICITCYSFIVNRKQ